MSRGYGTRSDVFRTAMLGGDQWVNVPLILEIMTFNKEKTWVATVSHVLARLLNKTAKDVPSPFAAMLLYIDQATAEGYLTPSHAKVTESARACSYY